MRLTKDPMVLYGDTFKKFRVQFWEYGALSLLKVFAELCQHGQFGRIRSFSGAVRARTGDEYCFQWEKGESLILKKGKVDLGSGYIWLRGELDFFTINRLRNFPLFHLRGCYRKKIDRKWGYHD